MIAIVDYGVGNLFSLSCSLKKIGVGSIVTGDRRLLDESDGIILPGVGAFGDAARKLEERGLAEYIKEAADAGKPLLGICLGMQMLFDKSYEYGEHAGLGLISGEVRPLSQYAPGLKIPHMGWNSLDIADRECPILEDTEQGDYLYFVHSYCGVCARESDCAATAFYGSPVTAVVAHGNVFGTQFHPEKSGETGLKILKAFARLTR